MSEMTAKEVFMVFIVFMTIAIFASIFTFTLMLALDHDDILSAIEAQHAVSEQAE